jgi:hypothetical protein
LEWKQSKLLWVVLDWNVDLFPMFSYTFDEVIQREVTLHVRAFEVRNSKNSSMGYLKSENVLSTSHKSHLHSSNLINTNTWNERERVRVRERERKRDRHRERKKQQQITISAITIIKTSNIDFFFISIN